MKRWIGGIVTLVCICCMLGLSGTVLAAGNAFVDVPVNHWAYTAITKLAQDGVLQGYRNTDYQGDKAITRYEMAMLVANAMARSEKANADDQALIQRLAAEFTQELGVLGVHVASLEKKADKMHMFGLGDFKYEHHNLGKDYGTSLVGSPRLVLRFDYQINNDWTVFNGLEYTRDLWMTTFGDITSDNSKSKELGATGKIGGATRLTVGEYHYFSAYGVMLEQRIYGAQLTFGDTGLAGGPPPKKPQPTLTLNEGYLWKRINGRTDSLFTDSDPHIFSGELKYPLSEISNIQLGRFNVWSDNHTISSRHFSTMGFDVKMTNDLQFNAYYGKSSYDTENLGYLVGFFYKNVNFMQPGSYGYMLNYEHIECNSAISPTFAVNASHGAKGVVLDYKFCPVEKTVVELLLTRIKATKANDTYRDNFFSVDISYFF